MSVNARTCEIFPFVLERELCEGNLNLIDITTAMRGLSTGKTPGPDGLPQELYAKFWNLLGPHLLKVFNFSLEKGFLASG